MSVDRAIWDDSEQKRVLRLRVGNVEGWIASDLSGQELPGD